MWNFKKLLDFSDKTVIITGGAGLLGRVYAVALLQTGAKVILFDKKIDKRLDIKVANYLPGQSIRVSVIVQEFSPVTVKISW